MTDQSAVGSYSISQTELRRRLLAAAWFLLAYELLRGDIVDRLKQLFVTGHTMNGLTYDPAYQNEVLALDPKFVFGASLRWLHSRGALDSNDVQSAFAIRKHRNEVAHQLPGLIIQRDAPTDRRLQEEIARLIAKLGRHWAVTRFSFHGFDPADPETPPEVVYSSTMIIAGMFASIAGIDGQDTSSDDDQPHEE